MEVVIQIDQTEIIAAIDIVSRNAFAVAMPR
jgi:hypothetical protein